MRSWSLCRKSSLFWSWVCSAAHHWERRMSANHYIMVCITVCCVVSITSGHASAALHIIGRTHVSTNYDITMHYCMLRHQTSANPVLQRCTSLGGHIMPTHYDIKTCITVCCVIERLRMQCCSSSGVRSAHCLGHTMCCCYKS